MDPANQLSDGALSRENHPPLYEWNYLSHPWDAHSTHAQPNSTPHKCKSLGRGHQWLAVLEWTLCGKHKWPPEDVHVQIPRTCEHVRFHANEEWRVTMESELLIIRPEDRDIILDYPSVPKVTQVSLKQERRLKERTRQKGAREDLSLMFLAVKEMDEARGQGRGTLWPLNTGQGKATHPPSRSWRNTDCLHLRSSPVRPVSDFWTL